MNTNYVPGPGTGNAKLNGSQSLPPEPTKRLDFILACVSQCDSCQSPAPIAVMPEGPVTLLQLIWWTIDKVTASIKLQTSFCLPSIITPFCSQACQHLLHLKRL